MAGSNYWIIIDPSWGSKCSSGAQQAVGANVAASCGYSSPAQSLRFLFLRIEEQPTVVQGSNSKGGSLTVDEARQRERRGNDKLQARKARKRHHQPLNTMRHRDVERVQHSGTSLAVAKGGEEMQRGTVSSLGLISHHSSLAPGCGIRS
ncbi:hypothetical protein LA080_015206 [Diaporthe eres]|nr:hypothetical protein LA080_015206 [Diaporthe eres]